MLISARRVVQALHVVGQAEDGRPLRRVVAADALEHARAVVQSVSPHVDARVVPVDELAVHPDLLGCLHRGLLWSVALTLAEEDPRSSRRRCAAARPARARPCGRASRRRTTPSSAGAAFARSGPRGRAGAGTATTAPGSKPVASKTSSAVATRTSATPAAPATLAASARRSPGTSATTYERAATNTIDFTIWSSEQPIAFAAASAVGVPCENSWIVASAAAARSSRATRSTGSGHIGVRRATRCSYASKARLDGRPALDVGAELGERRPQPRRARRRCRRCRTSRCGRYGRCSA